MVERLCVLLNAMNHNRKWVREVAEAMLFLEQKWEGSGVHCLARGHCAQRGSSGCWVGDLRNYMTDCGISVEGGNGLAKLRQDDFCIVDNAPDSVQGYVSAGLWCIEMWRASEFFKGCKSMHCTD